MVNDVGDFVSLLFMAVALGMDAFSVSLGIGMQRLRLKRVALISLTIGLFHILMPALGIVAGQMLSTKIDSIATLAGGLLLVAIGAQMFFSAFNAEMPNLIAPVGFGLLALAFSVSLDSFSVGLGLGISGVKTAMAIAMFGFFSMLLTMIGLLLGRKVRGVLGVYSEMLGGSILCAFGLNIIFG
nr:manganese efflux pump MntP family protein [Lentibacillus saliphilus]